jgi:hypothetical protein
VGNVAIVKSSWAGWRQGLRDQMVRDFDAGVEDSIREWVEAAGQLTLEPLEFIDGGDVVLVRAVVAGEDRVLCFIYTLEGRRVVGWDAYESEAQAREAAGLLA